MSPAILCGKFLNLDESCLFGELSAVNLCSNSENLDHLVIDLSFTSIIAFTLAAKKFLKQLLQLFLIETRLHKIFKPVALDVIHVWVDNLSPFVRKLDKSIILWCSHAYKMVAFKLVIYEHIVSISLSLSSISSSIEFSYLLALTSKSFFLLAGCIWAQRRSSSTTWLHNDCLPFSLCKLIFSLVWIVAEWVIRLRIRLMFPILNRCLEDIHWRLLLFNRVLLRL